MDLVKENIENLTSLWQKVGELANVFRKEKSYSYCSVSNSEWPNRLWFTEEINETNLKDAKEFLTKSSIELKIPYWDISQKHTQNLFAEYGFEKTLEQFGMSLKLDKIVETKGIINLKKVENTEDAILWSDLFQLAFNYRISHKLVLLSCKNVEYFIAYFNHTPVGTSVLFANSENVSGIHSMGIIPEMRRRGFAGEIFKEMLNRSIEGGFGFAMLQASAMARSMYEKFGFNTQFIMANYQLKK